MAPLMWCGKHRRSYLGIRNDECEKCVEERERAKRLDERMKAIETEESG